MTSRCRNGTSHLKHNQRRKQVLLAAASFEDEVAMPNAPHLRNIILVAQNERYEFLHQLLSNAWLAGQPSNNRHVLVSLEFARKWLFHDALILRHRQCGPPSFVAKVERKLTLRVIVRLPCHEKKD